MSNELGSRPTIFLVEEDDDARPVLRQNLANYGYRVMLTVDEENALERVGDGGVTRADLFLVNLVGRMPEEVLRIGRRIREHGKYDGNTPLVVMAEKYGADLEGTDARVGDNDWVTYLGEPDQLKNLLRRLTSK